MGALWPVTVTLSAVGTGFVPAPRVAARYVAWVHQDTSKMGARTKQPECSAQRGSYEAAVRLLLHLPDCNDSKAEKELRRDREEMRATHGLAAGDRAARAGGGGGRPGPGRLGG